MTSALAPRVPKHQKLTEILRRQVEGGKLRPGDRLPSFAELRKRYGISQATIERIYATLEHEGLAVREQGRGTFVARIARRASTGILGVMGARRNEWQNSLYWARLLDGAREVAAGHDLQILLIDVDSKSAPWEKIDGVLLAGIKKAGRNLLVAPVPKVSLLVTLPGVPSVGADDYGGMFAATEHLLALGPRCLGLVGVGSDSISTTRYAAYSSALEDVGIQPDPRWVRRIFEPFDEKEPFFQQGRDRMREWIEGDWNELGCTALIAQNDQVTVGAIQSLGAAAFAFRTMSAWWVSVVPNSTTTFRRA